MDDMGEKNAVLKWEEGRKTCAVAITILVCGILSAYGAWRFRVSSGRPSPRSVSASSGRSGQGGAGGGVKASTRPADVTRLLDVSRSRRGMAAQFVTAYRHYCWPVHSIRDIRLAPFHLLATEGAVHVDKDHVWHMDTLAGLCRADGEVLLATPYRVIDVTSAESVAEGTGWWEDLTHRGGEGMVVKPLDFVTRGRKGLAQPAVKVRGREYLRTIYGPEYTDERNLSRLRARHLGAKRSLALREFALGVEALERFIRHEPLRRVHECVFGVLALESEPVDPRL
jgi:protein phosphatase